MTAPVLTQLDRDSAAWKRLVEHYTARLAALRQQNDSDQTAEKTEKLRGRIAEVRYLLSLGTDRPEIPGEDKKFKD